MTAGELRRLLFEVPDNAEVMIRAPLRESLGSTVDHKGNSCGNLSLPTNGIRFGMFSLGSPPGVSPSWVSIEGCGPWAQSGRIFG